MRAVKKISYFFWQLLLREVALVMALLLYWALLGEKIFFKIKLDKYELLERFCEEILKKIKKFLKKCLHGQKISL